eukprot:224801-Chlamydomonas_euryale.AAC.1
MPHPSSHLARRVARVAGTPSAIHVPPVLRVPLSMPHPCSHLAGRVARVAGTPSAIHVSPVLWVPLCELKRGLAVVVPIVRRARLVAQVGAPPV